MTKSKSQSRSHSGGGKTPTRVGIRTAPQTTKAVSPAGAADIGIKKGSHTTDHGEVRRKLEPLVTSQPREAVAMGNTKALDVGKGGPGTGRTIHKSGSQGTHGAANPGMAPLTPTPGGGPGGFGFKGGK